MFRDHCSYIDINIDNRNNNGICSCTSRCGLSGKTQSRAWARHLERQLRPSGLLQFRILQTGNMEADGNKSGYNDDSVIEALGDGCYAIQRDFVVDTTVNYSLNKQYRWDLIDVDMFTIDSSQHLSPQEGLQVFLLEDEFTNFVNRVIPYGSYGKCNLPWILDAQSILRTYRDAVRLIGGALDPNSHRYQQRKVNLRERQKRLEIEALTREFLTKLKDELKEYYSNHWIPSIELPVLRYHQSQNQLLYIPVQQPGNPSGSSQIDALLSEALTSPPRLLVRGVTACRWTDSIYRPPPPRQRSRKNPKQEGRRQARQEAADGLNDWLVERECNRQKKADAQKRRQARRYTRYKYRQSQRFWKESSFMYY